MTGKRIPALDTYRGIAILLVASMHIVTTFIKTSRPDTYNPVVNLVLAGGTGVMLFFVLSGFLVSRPFVRQLIDKKPFGLEGYIAQRTLRIIPLYWVVVVLSALYLGKQHQILYGMFFMLRKVTMGFFSAVWWSLLVEVKFYMVLPLIFLILHYRPGRILAYILLGGYALVFTAYCLYPAPFPRFVQTDLFLVFPSFLAGSTLAVLYETGRIPMMNRFFSLTGAALMVLVLSVYLRPLVQMVHRTGNPAAYFFEPFFWAGSIFFLLSGQFSYRDVLSKTLTFLARISYSLYLIHLPVVYLIKESRMAPHLSGWQLCGVALVLSLSLSYASCQLIERPFLSLKRLLAKKKQHN